MSAIQILLILKFEVWEFSNRVSHSVSYNSLGRPFACAAMIVMSPNCGLELSRGMYCLTSSFKTSSEKFAVESGYSLIC